MVCQHGRPNNSIRRMWRVPHGLDESAQAASRFCWLLKHSTAQPSLACIPSATGSGPPCRQLPSTAALAFHALQAVATDGDADLVRLAKRNLPRAAGSGASVAAAVLPWGDAAAARALLQQYGRTAADCIILSDVVYGSDPGVWRALLATLLSVADDGTLVLQCESRRVEGVLYPLYWELIGDHFTVRELPVEASIMGPEVGDEACAHGVPEDAMGAAAGPPASCRFVLMHRRSNM